MGFLVDQMFESNVKGAGFCWVINSFLLGWRSVLIYFPIFC